MNSAPQGIIQIARYIDHTLLRPESITPDFERLCIEAIAHQFFSVCIPPARVSLCKKLLKNSAVKVCTVVGFPLGNCASQTKAFATKTAIEHGADEIDMVLNISSLKSGEHLVVLEDIKAVVRSAAGRPVKVILETGLLTDEEKRTGCTLSIEAGAQFVKTSTGFGSGGATPADVSLMLNIVRPKLQVKASGGIKDYKTTLAFIELGATRIGTSHGVAIITQSTAPTVSGY